MHPDRIVLGGIDERSLNLMEEIYAGFKDAPHIRTNNKTAETIKYASNALLATLISFSNELANYCTALGGVDIVDIMNGVHQSNYLSPRLPNGERLEAPITSFLEAGCGFGGSCLPKDVLALIASAREAGVEMSLLGAVMQTNEQQHKQILSLLKKHFPSLEGIRVTVLGLAFKPDTDDMRESPAIPVILDLLAEKLVVKAYDPAANHEAEKLFGKKIILCSDLASSIEDSQAILLITRWPEFSQLPTLISERDPSPLVIDGRRMVDKNLIKFYEGIGLG
jgi:UDPglucose 6-dehydrogenase/GDP-mannose 6-dehydrogenase